MQSCIIIYSYIWLYIIFNVNQLRFLNWGFVVTSRVHCSCELRDVMARYNFLVARQVIFYPNFMFRQLFL